MTHLYTFVLALISVVVVVIEREIYFCESLKTTFLLISFTILKALKNENYVDSTFFERSRTMKMSYKDKNISHFTAIFMSRSALVRDVLLFEIRKSNFHVKTWKCQSYRKDLMS